MFYRSENNQQFPLNINGSNTFGRYNDISIESTWNMFGSDEWLVPYAGYKVAIPSSILGNGHEGRGCLSSIKFNAIITVIGPNVYLLNLTFNQQSQTFIVQTPILIGTLATSTGIVYITENNNPQILISDNINLYLYDPSFTNGVIFSAIPGLTFVPGYVAFHDTYFLVAATYNNNTIPPARNTWRINFAIKQNTMAPYNPYWNDTDLKRTTGELQTKPDNIQAVVPFPGKGNMVFVFGTTVTECWFDNALQIFPYQKNVSFNIDYGCLNPATIASIDNIMVWLGGNEKSGPFILFSDGNIPQRISTDGIDYFLSNLQNPTDAQGFIFRQDGHVLYHINFYSDNVSLFYDFNTQKFFYASDENVNYFIASSLAFFNDQYYFITRNNGNLYAFDTIFTTYDGAIIPRIRTCKTIRLPTQDYFTCTDVGFTIESGSTDYFYQNLGPIYLITEDGKKLIVDGSFGYLNTEDEQDLLTEDDMNLVTEQIDNSVIYLIAEQEDIIKETPRVDLSISTDGGEHFSSYVSYNMPPIGVRKNKLMFWQIGTANDLVCQFRFYGIGRFVCTDGIANIRT